MDAQVAGKLTVPKTQVLSLIAPQHPKKPTSVITAPSAIRIKKGVR